MTASARVQHHRRGACPGLSTPMPTGDGLLVRLVPIGTIPLAAFAQLCAAARTFGNGIIEVTSRGSVQVRGLTAASAPDFAASVATLGIKAEDGVPVICNALAGLDAAEIFDAAAFAADLRRALARQSMAAKLGAKVSVAIDGGGALGLDAIAADIRLCAQVVDGAVVLRVAVGGDGTSAAQLGNVVPEHGIESAVRLLDAIARRGREARARDIAASVFRSEIAELFIPARPRESGDPALDSRLGGNERRASEPIGQHRLRDGSLACGIGLAFGHADATSLERLVAAAAASGASGLRAAPGRALMVIGLTAETAAGFIAAAEQLGFIIRPEDIRRRVIACAGAPICASAHIASRAIALRIAAAVASSRYGAFTIHLSGCAKGCAHAAPAALTVVGTPGGCALIANGLARDAPLGVVPADELPAAIAKYAREHVSVTDHV
jgi:precorrin-3B synthase